MSDFEDNNPFSGTERRLSSSSGIASDFAPLSINNHGLLGPESSRIHSSNEGGLNISNSSAILDDSVSLNPEDTSGFTSVLGNDNANSNKGGNDETNATNSSNPPQAYSTKIELIFYTDPDATITIVDAGKSHEGSSRGFISYTIKIRDVTVRRRYSEFESLRITLTKLFPTLIIPPIPEKHSMCKS